MSYPGNSSLAAPVKDRVVSTFQQTLALYKQGRKEEVAAGCNLILQMDPMFDPAKKLLEKTRNPNAPIDVDTLLPSTGGGDPMQAARDAMQARDFERVVHLTTEILTNDLLNDDARILGDEAREKIEAEPFIAQFARKCEQSLAAGDVRTAKADLEKMRSLDATHPEVVRIANAVAQRETGPQRAAAAAAATAEPSFVIDDTAQATGRAAAPASDFGFTFEEAADQQQPGFSSFSFDSPSESPFNSISGATPTASSPGEFDFSTASVSTTPDDQKKIEQYLADGDRAFAASDYQQAIDLWSRIFLIDVTNDQASERIERAKAKRREIEQKIESLVASAESSMASGDKSRARADLNEALRLDPNNSDAQDAISRLDGEGGTGAAAIPPSSTDDKLDLDFFEDEPLPPGFEGPLVPPSPGEAAAAAAAAAAPAAAASSKKEKPQPIEKAKAKRSISIPVGPIVAVLVLLALGAGGWFVWTRFMNKPAADPAATEAIFARANMLAGRGRIDEAIALLQDIKPDDPQHVKALEMIADLKQKKTTEAQMIEGMPVEEYFNKKMSLAKAAFEQHDYPAAKSAWDDAQRVKPLPADVKPQYDQASQQVAKLDSAKALFGERKYADAITNLQPLLEQDPQNAGVRQMIVNAHFNLGAQALQEERTADAIKEFDEVLKVNANDELARRSRELAVRYDKQSKDLLYRIYVKYLPLRAAA